MENGEWRMKNGEWKMENELKYIELKEGFSHDGPAWIGLVSYSKSGRTIYFNGKAFQSIGSSRSRGNYYDIESGEEYWISGVKKDMTDRHQFGTGKINVDTRIVDNYLRLTGQSSLDTKKYSICKVIEELPIDRIHQLENTQLESSDELSEKARFKKPAELTDKELIYMIDYYEEDSIHGLYLKGRKFSRNKMNELLSEKTKRETNSINIP
jgi:hypothetical protein